MRINRASLAAVGFLFALIALGFAGQWLGVNYYARPERVTAERAVAEAGAIARDVRELCAAGGLEIYEVHCEIDGLGARRWTIVVKPAARPPDHEAE